MSAIRIMGNAATALLMLVGGTAILAVSTGASAAGAAAVPICRTTALRITLDSPDGAAGHFAYRLHLKNVGKATCSLHGYPHVAFVAGKDRHPVGRSAAWVDSRGPHSAVLVKPGGQASGNLTITNRFVYGPVCHATPVTALRILPPGNKRVAYLKWPAVACSNHAAPLLSVTQVVAGSHGEF